MFAKLTSAALYASSHVKEALRPESDAKAQAHPMLTYGYPGDTCCTVYRDYNFSGWAKTFCLNGDKFVAFDMHDYGLNDEVDSINCGKNVRYTLCEDSVFNYCGSDYGCRGAGNVAINELLDCGDIATTLWLYDYSVTWQPYATIFRYENCRGTHGTLSAPHEFGVIEEYLTEDMESRNILNN